MKILEGEMAESLLLAAVLAGQKLLEEHVGLPDNNKTLNIHQAKLVSNSGTVAVMSATDKLGHWDVRGRSSSVTVD